MTTSRVPQVIDYLVATFQAATATTLAGVTVFDGPEVTGAAPQMAIYVGVDDIDSPDAQNSADSQQEWAGLGKQAINETVTVRCTAVAWSGSDDVRTVRQNAYAIMSAAEDLLRGDASLGGNVLFANPAVETRQLRQNTTTKGMVAQVTFDVTGKARIGG